MPSSSEGSRVWPPSFWAATWSTEIPAWMFAPSVLSGWTPVRKHDERPGVVAAAVAEGLGVVLGQAGQDQELVLERRERLERRRQREAGSLFLGRPVGHVHAVGDVEEGHPLGAGAVPPGPGGVARAAGRGRHRLEPGQGDGRAQAPQDRPAGELAELVSWSFPRPRVAARTVLDFNLVASGTGRS